MNIHKALACVFVLVAGAEVYADSRIQRTIEPMCTGGLAVAETSYDDIFLGAVLNIYDGPDYYGSLEFWSTSYGENPSEVDNSSRRQEAGCSYCIPDIRYYSVQYEAGYYWSFPRTGDYCPEALGGTGSWMGDTCDWKMARRNRCSIM